MSRTSQNGGPPCPKPQRLRDLIEFIGEEIEPIEESEHTSGRVFADACHDLIDALDWLATMLENRSLYHKKQQIKNKVLRSLAREYGLDDQANVITNDTLHNLVSNQRADEGMPEFDIPDITNTVKGDNDEDAK